MSYTRHHPSDNMTGPEFANVTEPVAVVIRPDGSVDVYGYVAVIDQRPEDTGSDPAAQAERDRLMPQACGECGGEVSEDGADPDHLDGCPRSGADGSTLRTACGHSLATCHVNRCFRPPENPDPEQEKMIMNTPAPRISPSDPAYTVADLRVYVPAGEEYSQDGLAAAVADLIAQHVPEVISVYQLRNDGFANITEDSRPLATQDDRPLA